MGKVLITDPDAVEGVPFLRGILTRSLQDAGLSFEDAYALASDIRQKLTVDERDIQISSARLERLVEKELRKRYGDALGDRYISWIAPPTTVYVRSNSNNRKPFSRGQFQHGLNPCGLPAEEAMNITSLVYEYLLNQGIKEISTVDLVQLTERFLRRESGKKAARRYVNWIELKRSNRPLIVLIGGVSGSGKSTIATELAHRLDIVRTQSTDMLREVMRLMIPERLVPVLHTSSFIAWQTLPLPDDPDALEIEPEELLTQGYQAQADLVAVACEGAIQRAIEERVSLILEGVHIHPTISHRIKNRGDAIIVTIMLGVLKQNELRDRIKGRRETAPDRRTQRYLEHFDNIVRLQSFLLSEADKAGVTIISNDDKETTVVEMMRTINHELEENFGTHD